MSTKNFVSYGDAETLMSGIKSAIDDAGGGGGSLQKVVVSSYTNTNTTIQEALFTFLNYLNSMTEEQKRNCFIDFYSSGASYWKSRLYWVRGNNDYQVFGITSENAYAQIGTTASTCSYDINGSSQSSSSLATKHITKIELCYMEARSAVVPSGGETIEYIAPIGGTSWKTFLNSIYNDLISKISSEEMAKCTCLLKRGTNYYRLIPSVVTNTAFQLECQTATNPFGSTINSTVKSTYTIHLESTDSKAASASSNITSDYVDQYGGTETRIKFIF